MGLGPGAQGTLARFIVDGGMAAMQTALTERGQATHLPALGETITLD